MALKDFAFKVVSKDRFARCGLIETHRGNINTPAFMPVGTQATVKACTIDDIKIKRWRRKDRTIPRCSTKSCKKNQRIS